MLANAARIYGIVFIIFGVLGFVPALTPDGLLFGIFHVNTGHNIVHLVTGLIAVFVGIINNRASKIFFLTFGIMYGIVACLGFVAGEMPLFGFMAHNVADAWLHMGIAAVSVFLGTLPEHDRSRVEQAV